MNNKKYIVLLSLFVACTGRAMQYKDLSSFDEIMRYCIVAHKEFSDVYAVEQSIKHEVTTLHKADALTEDAMLVSIKNALKPYESNPDIEYALKRLYELNEKLVETSIEEPFFVFRYDANEAGSCIALSSYPDEENKSRLRVYEEISRGKWKCVLDKLADNRTYLYLLNDGTHVTCLQDGKWVTCSVKGDSANKNDSVEFIEKMEKELQKKHDENCNRGETKVIKGRTIEAYVRISDEKCIDIQEKGFRVRYLPTLKEIAQYLVKKA